MTPAGIVVAAIAGGALAGLGAGWVSVFLERIERLREEEDEERLEYEKDVARTREAASAAGQDPPEALPWVGESYGWTWLENILAPLLGAAGFGALVAHGPLEPGLLIHLLWIALFVHIVVFDLKHRLILNRITYPAVLLALALSPVSPGLTIVSALLGAASVFLFFYLQNVVSRGSIGLGDAKLGALLGAVTGVSSDVHHIGAAYAVIWAIFLGAGVALLLLVLRLRRLKDPIPYGPFLCAGAAIILYLGP
ncbi:MAG: prepilin peptidase [Candidatus Dormibacteraeota bacterium]|nr:prepilin peptidase [Candidatus Dormibacteraeota bacterium]